MPLLPLRSRGDETNSDTAHASEESSPQPNKTTNMRGRSVEEIRVKNRRKRYLDTHPEYFSSEGSLELADPLLYDRLVRRFQTAAEREAEGRSQGYGGSLERSLVRSEAKIDALANPDPNIPLNYRRGPNGDILAEEPGEVPASKEEAYVQWRKIMELRFLRGGDSDFDYRSVDDNEEYDDLEEERRAAEESYFDAQEPSWNFEDTASSKPTGETGVQDF